MKKLIITLIIVTSGFTLQGMNVIHLNTAALQGNVNAVQQALNQHVNVNAILPNGNTVLFNVATLAATGLYPRQAELFDIIKMLLSQGANPLARNQAGRSTLDAIRIEQNDSNHMKKAKAALMQIFENYLSPQYKSEELSSTYQTAEIE